jgi:hypothetical protein
VTPPTVTTVRNVVAVSVVLTLFHFTDNTINIDTYPKASWQPGWFSVVVALSWPAFTAIGVLAVRWYRRGDYARAHPALIAYSFAGLVSLGHFAYGGPSDLTTRAVISVFVDAVAGAAVLAVALRSISAHRIEGRST